MPSPSKSNEPPSTPGMTRASEGIDQFSSTSRRGIEEQWQEIKLNIGDAPTHQALNSVLQLAISIADDGDKILVGTAQEKSAVLTDKTSSSQS